MIPAYLESIWAVLLAYFFSYLSSFNDAYEDIERYTALSGIMDVITELERMYREDFVASFKALWGGRGDNIYEIWQDSTLQEPVSNIGPSETNHSTETFGTLCQLSVYTGKQV
jgi:hypothetical protein